MEALGEGAVFNERGTPAACEAIVVYTTQNCSIVTGTFYLNVFQGCQPFKNVLDSLFPSFFEIFCPL